MGCCKSVLRVSIPVKANMYRRSQEPFEEETKNPEFYRQPSYDVNVEATPANSAGTERGFLLGSSSADVPRVNQDIYRKQSEFNLQKDPLESIRRERSLRKESGVKDTETSTYHITQEQHNLIYKFIEEISNILEVELTKLNENLMYNVYEHEELHMIMKDLKSGNKDVENSIEDLRAYPIQNEQHFYSELGRRFVLVRKIIEEYTALQNNSYNYRDFREDVMELIRRYRERIQDDNFDYNAKDVFGMGASKIKLDDGVKDKETAVTLHGAETGSDRTEGMNNGSNGGHGNWSHQSENSGGSVENQQISIQQTLERRRIDSNHEYYTGIYKSDVTPGYEGYQANKEAGNGNNIVNGAEGNEDLQQTHNYYQESVESSRREVFTLTDLFARKGYSTNEMLGEDVDSKVDNGLQGINITLKQEKDWQKAEKDKKEDHTASPSSGYLAIQRKIMRNNKRDK